MIIGNYVIRILVALFLGISFIVTTFTYLETKRYDGSVDLTTYVSFGVFIMCTYLLWVIK